MRYQHQDGTVVHLAYCTNVHAAEDLRGVIEQLDRYAEPIRQRLAADRLGLGLWLARDVASELADDPAAVRKLRAELDARGLEVVTFNGFPYAGFGGPVVKHRVYRPDWAEPERFAYTVDLVRLLAELMPEDVARGSISTLPLGWRTRHSDLWYDEAAQHVKALDRILAGVAVQTGRLIRVGFEPEPGCVVESTEDAVRHLENLASDHIGICLDACHLAVGHESPEEAIARLIRAGLDVVKVQAAAALTASEPRSAGTRSVLAGYAEPRFLHQTREMSPSGLRGVDDLDDALAAEELLPGVEPWRIHFHVPLHRPLTPPLGSTVSTLESALDTLIGGPATMADHIEVETYTWPVMPGAPIGVSNVVEGIAGELAWMRKTLTGLGLREIAA